MDARTLFLIVLGGCMALSMLAYLMIYVASRLWPNGCFSYPHAIRDIWLMSSSIFLFPIIIDCTTLGQYWLTDLNASEGVVSTALLAVIVSLFFGIMVAAASRVFIVRHNSGSVLAIQKYWRYSMFAILIAILLLEVPLIIAFVN